jgi:hypothetical protein
MGQRGSKADPSTDINAGVASAVTSEASANNLQVADAINRALQLQLPGGGNSAASGYNDVAHSAFGRELLAEQEHVCSDGYYNGSDPADLCAYLEPEVLALQDASAVVQLLHDADALPLPLGQRVNAGADRAPIKWKRGDLIGSGAYGRVYLGLNEADGALIAAKQIPLSVAYDDDATTDSVVAALEKEIALMSRLRHENIVRYLGSQREEITSAPVSSSSKGNNAASAQQNQQHKEEVLTIFMEFVPGGSIA